MSMLVIQEILPQHQSKRMNKYIGIFMSVALATVIIGIVLYKALAVEGRPVPPENEPVMTPGMRIIANTPVGTIDIRAGNGRKRSYTWDGATRSIEMWPRKERWNGSMGLYFPGPGEHWIANHGITRCVAEEGQLNFSSLEKAMTWLSEKPGHVSRIYRNDGLSVWLSKVPERRQLGVDVFQIYINGHMPTQLAGAQDDKIQIVAKEPIPQVTKAPADSNEFNENNASYSAAKRASLCFYHSFFAMAESAYKEHRYRDALTGYTKAIFAKPSVYLYLQQARCLIELGDFTGALHSCDLAYEIDHSYADIATVRAEAKHKAGKINERIEQDNH